MARFDGFVLVLAIGGDGTTGAEAREAADRLRASGAMLAVLSRDEDLLSAAADMASEHVMAWRVDPADPGTWERIPTHVEQRLGPIDGVVADAVTAPLAAATLDGDFRRRGHGGVVVLRDGGDVVSELLSLVRRP